MVVRHDDAAGTHNIEIVGELAALLGLAQNTNAAAIAAASNSLKLVAGTRSKRLLLLIQRRIPHVAA